MERGLVHFQHARIEFLSYFIRTRYHQWKKEFLRVRKRVVFSKQLRSCHDRYTRKASSFYILRKERKKEKQRDHNQINALGCSPRAGSVVSFCHTLLVRLGPASLVEVAMVETPLLLVKEVLLREPARLSTSPLSVKESFK